MSEPLVTDVEDHLAGAAYAIDLLGAIRDQHAGEPLGQFAVGMLVEVEADNGVLKALAERIGTGSSGLKGLAAWMAEKVSRVKLRRGASDGLGTFEALEFLALGIQGKLALWRALAVVGPGDPRLKDLDFDHLAARRNPARPGGSAPAGSCTHGLATRPGVILGRMSVNERSSD